MQGRQQRREHAWPVVFPHSNEWVPWQCAPNSTSPLRPRQHSLGAHAPPQPPMPFHSPLASPDTCELGTGPPGACFVSCTCNAQGQSCVGHKALNSSLGTAQQQHVEGSHVAGLVARWTLRTGTCVSTWDCSTSLWCSRSRAGGDLHC